MLRLLALLSMLAAGTALSAAGVGQQAAGREEFLAAMNRVRLHLPEPPDPPALKGFPIYHYLLAARLRRDLDSTPLEPVDAAINEFMRTHAGLPVTRTLQHAWLTSLAE